jgi:hypothetical protein
VERHDGLSAPAGSSDAFCDWRCVWSFPSWLMIGAATFFVACAVVLPFLCPTKKDRPHHELACSSFTCVPLYQSIYSFRSLFLFLAPLIMQLHCLVAHWNILTDGSIMANRFLFSGYNHTRKMKDPLPSTQGEPSTSATVCISHALNCRNFVRLFHLFFFLSRCEPIDWPWTYFLNCSWCEPYSRS